MGSNGEERGVVQSIFSFIDELDAQVDEIHFIRWFITLGNFFGHFVPGSVFMIMFFHWTTLIIRHYVSVKAHGKVFESVLWLPMPLLKRWPWATVNNILLTCMTLLTVVIFAGSFDDQGRFAYYDNSQHVVMFSAFIVHFLIINLQSRNLWLLPSIDYLSLTLAYFIKAVVIINHLSGQNRASPLKMQVHILLAMISVAEFLVIVIEMFSRHRLLLSVLRCYLCLLDATWLYHITFTLYRLFSWQPIVDQTSRKAGINCTSMFAGYCLLDFIFFAIFAHFLHLRFNRREQLKRHLYPDQADSLNALLPQ